MTNDAMPSECPMTNEQAPTAAVAAGRTSPLPRSHRGLLAIGTWSLIGHWVIGHWSFLPLVCALSTFAAEPTIDPKELPRTPPVEPAQALSTFKVRPGFHLELVASEPLVIDPIAMSFDENGRLFVVEMRDYSERRPERLGRIRMLEDTDGDGRFDKSTVFAEDLPWPTAVFCYGGGVFVGATPEILFCKDTNGDGRADVKEIVFTGFASDYAPYQTNRLNVQALLNSFHWGLDNRIHGSASASGGKVRLEDSPFTRAWRRRAASLSPSSGGEGRGEDGSKSSRLYDLKSRTGEKPV